MNNMKTNYTPGQILYIKPEYGEAYISVIAGTSPIPQNEGILIHTCCDLTIHEYDGNMYHAGVTFARGNGTLLGVDTTFEEIRQAEDFEKKMLFDALVRGFKDHDLGWAKHFTDSTYDDIRDWLCWEFDVDLDNMDNNNPLGVTIYEITNYIWDALCKETNNYQACTDYVEPEMVNKAEFIAKVKRWLELETDWNMEYDECGRNDNYGKIDELVKYLEE
jgi:hypothetical protein